MSEPSIVVEPSSGDEETISTINTRTTGCPSTPNSQCSICINELTNPCHTDSCLHSFCFKCLRRWSNSAQSCPLCKKTFNYIYHSFDDLGVHETYDVPTPRSDGNEIVSGGAGLEYTSNTNDMDPISQTPITGQAMRIQVYVDNMWAKPLQGTTPRIRHCSSNFYRDNPSHRQRLHLFILRDVIAIRESLRLEPMPLTNITVTNFIMQALLTYEISQLHSLTFLRPFLESRAVQFCHELFNFASSPYNIMNYDRYVQYTYRPRATKLTERFPIVLNSDNKEVQRTILMNNIKLSTDNSDAVIQCHSIRSIEPLNFASIDQPSTSTGIQDSLNQWNNGFQSVGGGSSSYPFHVKRWRPNLDSSSDDEDS